MLTFLQAHARAAVEILQVVAGLALGLLSFQAALGYRDGRLGRGMRWVAGGLITMALANLGLVLQATLADHAAGPLDRIDPRLAFGAAVFGGFLAAALGFRLVRPSVAPAPARAAPAPRPFLATRQVAQSDALLARLDQRIEKGLARLTDPWLQLAVRTRLAIARRLPPDECLLACQEVLVDVERRLPGPWAPPTPTGGVPAVGPLALFDLPPARRLPFLLGEVVRRLRALLSADLGVDAAAAVLREAGLAGAFETGEAAAAGATCRAGFQRLLDGAHDGGLGRAAMRRIVEQAAREVGRFVPLSSFPEFFACLPPDCLVQERAQHAARAALWEEFLRARQQLGEALDEARRGDAESFARAVVHGAPDGFVTAGPDGRITSVNPAAARLLGRPAETLVGLALRDALPGLPAPVLERLAAAGPDEAGGVVELALPRADGGTVSVEVALSATSLAGGRLVVAALRDLSERLRQQEEIRRAQAHLATLGQLAAGIGHEINNPATYVIANLDVLGEWAGGLARAPRDDAYLDEVRSMIEECREGMGRIRHIVRDLQTFSRTRALRPELTGLDTIVDSALRFAAVQVRHRAELVRARGPTPEIWVDPSRIGQVVLNLVVNAAHAIPEGHAREHRITVATGAADGGVFIEVADTGVGIAPDHLARIFDPFFTTKGEGHGTGLGLFICREIVEQHAGRLEVRSALGRGTTFRVWLPLLAGGDEADVVPAVRVARPLRLLVVDDEEALLRAFARNLEGAHRVVTAASGREALAVLRRDAAFDAVVCDLHMPDLSGMELYRTLAAEAPTLTDRFLFMTGGHLSLDATEFVRDHGDRVLLKPVGPAEVLAAAERVAQRRPATAIVA